MCPETEIQIVWKQYTESHVNTNMPVDNKFVLFVIVIVGVNYQFFPPQKYFLQSFEMVRGRRGAWGDTSYHPEGD